LERAKIDAANVGHGRLSTGGNEEINATGDERFFNSIGEKRNRRAYNLQVAKDVIKGKETRRLMRCGATKSDCCWAGSLMFQSAITTASACLLKLKTSNQIDWA
jgi:hypothetical protein